jgi:hypothetical protein
MKLIVSWALAGAVLMGGAPAVAGEQVGVTAPSTYAVNFIERAEAASVLQLLAKTQDDLRTGTEPPFPYDLSSGSVVLYDEVAVAPRDAFLALDLDKVALVQPDRNVNSVLKVYDITVSAGRQDSRIWKVRMWVNGGGNVEKIDLHFGPPAPF